MGFNEIMQDLVNRDDEFKIKLAVDCYADLLPVFKQFDPDTDGMIITYAILATTAAADRQLSEKEFMFIDGLLDAAGAPLSHEEIVDLVVSAANDENAYGIVKEVRDHLDDEGVNTLVNLIAAICSIDDRISPDEVALIKSLL